MEPKRYATAAAFRRALEDRLQDIAGKESVDLQRLRRQVAFDRLLARLFQVGQSPLLPWVLKGGYAMELRIKAARTTKDIDLTMRSVFNSSDKKDSWIAQRWRSGLVDPAGCSRHSWRRCGAT